MELSPKRELAFMTVHVLPSKKCGYSLYARPTIGVSILLFRRQRTKPRYAVWRRAREHFGNIQARVV